MADQSKQKKIKFHIDQKDEGGVYSNFATVIHSETEFLLDFGMFLPGRDAIRIGSRVVLSPRAAKSLLAVLQRNIQNYEKQYGEISMPKSPTQFPSSAMTDLAQ